MITFFVPRAMQAQAPLPSRIEDYHAWQLSAARVFNALGPFNWTVQTALQLRAAGVEVTLGDTVTDDGTLISHRDFLPRRIPGPRELVVCLLADRGRPGDRGRSPSAALHIVQNPTDPLVTRPRRMWPSVYAPFWPQPELVGRDPARGDRVERIGYFGIVSELAPELTTAAFRGWLAARGMTFEIVPRERWSDYRDVDVTLSVRAFGDQPFHDKPASKLVNSWIAGVPAIVGQDSAYSAVRTGPLDFLAVRTLDDVKIAIDGLRRDPARYRALREQAARRGHTCNTAMTVAAWQAIVAGPIAAVHAHWKALPRALQLAEVAARTAEIRLTRRVRAAVGRLRALVGTIC